MAGQVNPQTGQPVAVGNNIYGNAPIPFNNSDTLAHHAYHTAVNALNNQQDETLQYYGMGKSGRIDPHNLYGQRQLLERGQGEQLGQLANAQQQSGLLGMYGSKGLASQQRNTALFAQGQETAQLLKDFQDRMNAIKTGRQEAKWQKGATETSGTLQAIMNAISAGAFTPAAPVGS
jgi:hypothetical protein